MRRRYFARGVALVALLAAVATPAPGADLVSKQFEFKAGVILEIGATTADGLRLDSVRFLIPVAADGTDARTGGQIGAEIAVSNESNDSHQVGLAIALFDEAGRLVGVSSGGSRVLPLKPSRQKTYKVVFYNVNTWADSAATFQISLESR